MRTLLILATMTLLPATATEACGSIILTYSGTLHRTGNDPAGLVGASFVWNAVFDYAPYVDNGLGQASLPLLRSASSFTISGANDTRANGEYVQPFTVSMIPSLEGALVPLPSNPSQFTRMFGDGNQLRLSSNFFDMFGGDGLSASIGELPLASHFPTSIQDAVIIALPHNSTYTVLNPTISLTGLPASNVVPEPSTLLMWSLIGLTWCGIRCRQRIRRFAPA